MERDGLQQFMAQTGHRILTREEERALAVRKDAGDKEAFEKLVLHNVRLVFSIARRFSGGATPLDDLIQYGILGLIHAVKKFDGERGFKFSTYATWWIKQAIDRGVTNSERGIRLPGHVDAEVRRLVRAERKLSETGADYSDDNLAVMLDLTVEKVRELRRVSQTVLSLDGFRREDGEAVDDGSWTAIADEGSVEDDVLGEAATIDVQLALARLSPRERRVIELRFGFDGGHDRTLDEIGADLGCSRQRAKQIQDRALTRLRYALAA
jgi:RNA polymerase sigma factor (sigma-70 family)